MTENIDFGGIDYGGIPTEEAGIALSEALKQVQKDPYFQSIILPMMNLGEENCFHILHWIS